MADYHAPLEDMAFALHRVVGMDDVLNLLPFEEFEPSLIDAILGEAAKLIEEEIAPLNREGDETGARYENGAVRLPPGFKEAYQRFTDGGWLGVCQSPDYGGQGLPHVTGLLLSEMMCAGNTAFSLSPALTRGVCVALSRHGADDLKQTYLPRLISGEWAGTMCLSEPQAGTDVGATRTRAVAEPDGSYRIDGGKIWITYCEHDLTEQIVHLVLARVEGAPPGPKGLSLFLVPKYLINGDGSLGAANGVRCLGIEKKMGIKAAPTGVLEFEGATGYLVGKENQGMRNMFTMMNYERVEMGVQGLGLAEHATQNAIAYAKERRQGGGGRKSADGPVAIIEHADVRRMLLTMKAYTEGMRMAVCWMGRFFDLAEHHPDAGDRQEAQDMVDLLTPVIKAFFSDLGVEVSNIGVQVLGGVGYVREYGLEQNIRDARIAPIYEGANGIQAMDLVRRKLMLHEGRLPAGFFARIEDYLKSSKDRADLAFALEPLGHAVAALKTATADLQSLQKEGGDAGGGGYDYLRALGLVTMGYLWARAAEEALAGGGAPDFSKRKLMTARFFFERLLVAPVEAALTAATAPNDTLYGVAAEVF